MQKDVRKSHVITLIPGEPNLLPHDGQFVGGIPENGRPGTDFTKLHIGRKSLRTNFYLKILDKKYKFIRQYWTKV
jgi:hypothetical protein